MIVLVAAFLKSACPDELVTCEVVLAIQMYLPCVKVRSTKPLAVRQSVKSSGFNIKQQIFHGWGIKT